MQHYPSLYGVCCVLLCLEGIPVIFNTNFHQFAWQNCQLCIVASHRDPTTTI